jgi:hypothetical protein
MPLLAYNGDKTQAFAGFRQRQQIGSFQMFVEAALCVVQVESAMAPGLDSSARSCRTSMSSDECFHETYSNAAGNYPGPRSKGCCSKGPFSTCNATYLLPCFTPEYAAHCARSIALLVICVVSLGHASLPAR